jgi:hypothetical protein
MAVELYLWIEDVGSHRTDPSTPYAAYTSTLQRALHRLAPERTQSVMRAPPPRQAHRNLSVSCASRVFCKSLRKRHIAALGRLVSECHLLAVRATTSCGKNLRAPVFSELVPSDIKKNVRFSYSLLTAFQNAMRELPHNLCIRLFSFHEYAPSVLKHYR